jgi:Na+-exporting ATPase
MVKHIFNGWTIYLSRLHQSHICISPDWASRRSPDYSNHHPCAISICGHVLTSAKVLILAMAVSFGIKSWIEGGVVAFIIGLNVTVGFFQEYSAEKTMDSLRSMSSPTASVVRDGDSKVIPSVEVVPGDLVEIKTGDTIPADIR